VLDPLNCAKHLRPDVLAAFDALQIAPGFDFGFVFEPSFKHLGERAAVCARVGDEDCLGRELHFA
jgi:hypothetical protein